MNQSRRVVLVNHQRVYLSLMGTTTRRLRPRLRRCLDERFELEVLAPLDRRVVSNTPVMMSNEETVVLPSGRKERRRRWRFAETPVMSTYLLALVRLLLLLQQLFCWYRCCFRSDCFTVGLSRVNLLNVGG